MDKREGVNGDGTAKQKPSRLGEAILETADSLHRVGAMDDETHARMTMRHLGRPARTRELDAKGD